MSKHKTGKQRREKKKRAERKAYRARRKLRGEAQAGLDRQGGGSGQPEIEATDHAGPDAVG